MVSAPMNDDRSCFRASNPGLFENEPSEAGWSRAPASDSLYHLGRWGLVGYCWVWLVG